MALVCPKCGQEGSSHLARNCNTCKTNGRPTELKERPCSPASTQKAPLIVPEAPPEELELARRRHLALQADDFEGFAKANGQLQALREGKIF